MLTDKQGSVTYWLCEGKVLTAEEAFLTCTNTPQARGQHAGGTWKCAVPHLSTPSGIQTPRPSTEMLYAVSHCPRNPIWTFVL